MVKKILKTTGQLVMGGVGIGLGASMLDKLPASPATTQVQAGMTTFAGFYPLMSTAAGMGLVVGELGKISKKVKRRKYR